MTAALERLWGCGDLDVLFTGHVQVPAPWPRAARRRHERTIDVSAVAALIAQPVDLVEVDPRGLHASQPWVVRHHASYYGTGEWERTGRTSADRHLELNQYPVVITDSGGRRVIVAGHHRATAALIAGRPLLVRTAAVGERFAVTPLLFVDPAEAVDVADACRSVDAGHRASVASLEEAAAVLTSFGLTDDEVRTR